MSVPQNVGSDAGSPTTIREGRFMKAMVGIKDTESVALNVKVTWEDGTTETTQLHPNVWTMLPFQYREASKAAITKIEAWAESGTMDVYSVVSQPE